MFAAYTWPPKRQALQMNYVISCSARNMKCFYQWMIVYFIIWSNQTTKHLGGVMLLKLCRILDHWRVMDRQRTGSFLYHWQSQKHRHLWAFLSWWHASARCLAVSKTALAATQYLLAQKGASAWQKMKDVGTPTVWPVSVTQKKAMKRVPLKRNCKIVDIHCMRHLCLKGKLSVN